MEEMLNSQGVRLVVFMRERTLQDFKEMINFVAKHKIKPHIMQEFPLVEVHETLTILVEGRALGKVLMNNFVVKP